MHLNLFRRPQLAQAFDRESKREKLLEQRNREIRMKNKDPEQAKTTETKPGNENKFIEAEKERAKLFDLKMAKIINDDDVLSAFSEHVETKEEYEEFKDELLEVTLQFYRDIDNVSMTKDFLKSSHSTYRCCSIKPFE